MRRGGGQPDPLRDVQEKLFQEPKRASASALRGLVLPLSIFPVCKIRQTAAQTIGTGAFATILMDATDIDNDGIADLAADQIKIKFPGLYLLTGKVAFVAGAATGRYARFLVNGVATGDCGPFTPRAADIPRIPCHDLVSLSRGDTVKLQGFQDTGGNLNTYVAAAEVQSTLWAVWVGVNT
jgi:hypothetical protein